jgi:hypothetical protein
MDHGDAYLTLAWAPTYVGQRAGISGTIQVISGADRRAFFYGTWMIYGRARSAAALMVVKTG